MTEEHIAESRPFYRRPAFRLVISLLIALAYAVLFYAIIQMGREYLRLLSAQSESFKAFLSPREQNIINLVTAAFTCSFGLSMGLRYFGERSKQVLAEKTKMMRRLIHWNRLLTWSFSLFVYFSFLTFGAGMHTFHVSFGPAESNFYEFRYLLVGLILFFCALMYTSTLRAMRLCLKGSFWRSALVLLSIGAAVFGLSRLHVIELDKPDKEFYSTYPAHRYDFELPHSALYERGFKENSLEGYYIVGYEDTYRYFDGDDLLDLDEILIRIRFAKERYGNNNAPPPIGLNIDRSTPMYIVEEFRQGLSALELLNVKYRVTNEEEDPFLGQQVFRVFIKPQFTVEESMRLDLFSDAVPNQIYVQLSDSLCVINGQLTPTEGYKNRLRQLIDDNPDHLLNLNLDPMTSFERYLELMVAHRSVIFDLRLVYLEEMQEEIDGTEQLAMGNQGAVRWTRELRSEFPIRVRENMVPFGKNRSSYELIVKKKNASSEADKQWELIKGKSALELYEMGMDTSRIGKSDYAVYSAEKFFYKDIEGLEANVFYSHRFGDERGKYVRIINERGSRDILLAMRGGDSNSYEISTEFLNDSTFMETRIDSESLDGSYSADTTVSLVRFDEHFNFYAIGKLGE